MERAICKRGSIWEHTLHCRFEMWDVCCIGIHVVTGVIPTRITQEECVAKAPHIIWLMHKRYIGNWPCHSGVHGVKSADDVLGCGEERVVDLQKVIRAVQIFCGQGSPWRGVKCDGDLVDSCSCRCGITHNRNCSYNMRREEQQNGEQNGYYWHQSVGLVKKHVLFLLLLMAFLCWNHNDQVVIGRRVIVFDIVRRVDDGKMELLTALSEKW